MKKSILIFAICFFIPALFIGQNKFGATPEDSMECVKNLELFKYYYLRKEQSKFDAAIVDSMLVPWRYVFYKAPEASLNIYKDGVKIFKFRYNSESDTLRKKLFFDTLMMIYDQRIKYFANEGYVLGRKGNDIFELKPGMQLEAYDCLKRSVTLQKNESEANVINNYLITSIQNFKSGKLPENEVIDVYHQGIGICDARISSKGDSASYVSVKRNLESLIIPLITCQNIYGVYKGRNYSASDTLFLKKLLKISEIIGCQKDSLYMDVLKTSFEVKPSMSAAVELANWYNSKKDFEKVIEIYKYIVSKEQNENALAMRYLDLALAYYNLGNLPESKKSCQKSIVYKPNMGMAYILSGIIVANSTCENAKDEVDKNSVYWLAVDYFQKAKSVDPSVAGEANKQIAVYSSKFPKKELAAERKINEGDLFTVPCFEEKTKARF